MGAEQNAEIERLRSVAGAAMTGHSWEWSGRGEHGYPQQVISQGDAALIAECYEGPDFPSSIAEFIATFDPPTVLNLLDRLTRPAPTTGREADDE